MDVVLLKLLNVGDERLDRLSRCKQRPNGLVHQKVCGSNAQRLITSGHHKHTTVDEDIASHKLIAKVLLDQKSSGVLLKNLLHHDVLLFLLVDVICNRILGACHSLNWHDLGLASNVESILRRPE